MIAGYPARTSVAPGRTLVLHVATDAARFRVGFYRWWNGFEERLVTPWRRGEHAPPRGPADDWIWPAYAYAIPSTWPSGVYVAHLEAQGAPAFDGGFDGPCALFVVRGTGPLLYKLPTATYQAYNWTGGGCFYLDPPRSSEPPGSKVSLRRPGGGIGGTTHGALDHYDLRSPRQSFAHWDAPFVRWLARAGYDVAFCTDFDVHDGRAPLDDARLLLSVGHDEYWSTAMRDRVEAFAASGGNVAFFGANVCWWRIHVVDDCGAIVCHQGGPRGALDHWWPETGAHRPEDALTGVSYRHGGGWWDGPRRTRGFFVQAPEHWAFAGTGLREGEAFGADCVPPLVGYECDGVPLDAFDDATGRATLAPDAQRHGTPAGYTVLAAGPLDDAWQELPPRAGFASGEGVHAATMGTFTTGGTTFSAGTTDWAQVLASGEPRVERITRNVIDRLSRP